MRRAVLPTRPHNPRKLILRDNRHYFVMRIVCCQNVYQWSQLQTDWDRLAGGCVFRTWRWLNTWWRHYGDLSASDATNLRVLLAFAYDGRAGAESQLAGALPCYLQDSAIAGRVLRLLGDGEVCSDHLGLLAAPAQADAVVAAMASALIGDESWDLLDFDAIDGADQTTRDLLAALRERGCRVDERPQPSCWRIALPGDWEEFLALQSKSHRKQLRRLDQRVLQTDDARWRLVESAADFERAWDVLADLHQRRRRSLGEPGCFSWPRWAAFHHDVAKQLLASGELRLSWLELRGRPVAAEYHLARGDSVFAYQGGLDPDAAEDEPGRLSLITTLKHAIGEGRTHFDLLRGDEPYKPHWRAEPQAVSRLLAVPPRYGPRLRYRARTAARAAGRWAKQATGLFS